jgi:hypothetical protein
MPTIKPFSIKIVKHAGRFGTAAKLPQRTLTQENVTSRKVFQTCRNVATRASEQEVLIDQDFMDDLNKV